VLSYFRSDVRAYVDEYVDVIGVVSGLAPAGLYFAIFLTYAQRMTDLAKAGALVYRARSIESLANATVLCFARASTLLGTRVRLEPISPPAGQARLSESRIRQILGDLDRSSGVDNPVNRALADAFEGTRRKARQEAPFLSAYGWSATAFDDDDLRGVYVLGEPEVLEEALASAETPIDGAETGGKGSQLWQKASASLAGVARRFRKAVRPEAGTAAQLTAAVPGEGEEAALDPAAGPGPGSRADKRIQLLRLLRERLASRLKRDKAVQEEESAAVQDPTDEGRVLLFAYWPEIAPLVDGMGQPHLPESLVLLGRLHFSRALGSESAEMLRAFAESGVRTKVLTTGPAEDVAALLQNPEAPVPLPSISGEELAAMDALTFARAVVETPVIGTVSPDQASQVVRTLRNQGEAVAVVGDQATDVPVLRQATLAIARRSSSPAAIGAADLVLLNDSPRVLLDVLNRGQRIANGVLDILELNLTQAFYLLLLIVSLGVLAQGFPYRGPYGTVVNLLTITIPSIAVIVWARPRVLPRARLGRLLARFVAPASISMAAVAATVYFFFEAKSGRMAYAQLAVTNFLAAAGLLLVVFLKPAREAGRNTPGEKRDWRSVRLAIILFALFLLLPAWSFTRTLFGLDWLYPSDYWLVGLAVAAWAVLINVLWWLARLLTPGQQRAPGSLSAGRKRMPALEP
jgi:magnesium-transporting ATPase (P-type)